MAFKLLPGSQQVNRSHIDSFPHCSLQLQQKALEVDSSRVSGAIQNLINSWKASDTQAEQQPESGANGSHEPDNRRQNSSSTAEPSGRASDGAEQARQDQSPEEQQRQEKRIKLLSLFSRGKNGKNGQSQPEEAMPLRVQQHACGTMLHCETHQRHTCPVQLLLFEVMEGA